MRPLLWLTCVSVPPSPQSDGVRWWSLSSIICVHEDIQWLSRSPRLSPIETTYEILPDEKSD